MQQQVASSNLISMLFFQTEDSEGHDGSDSDENFSENDQSAKEAALTIMNKAKNDQHRKRKRTEREEKSQPAKKHRSTHSSRNVRQEKQHSSVATKVEKDGSPKKDSSKQEEPKKDSPAPASEVIWNDRNCDHDLDDHAASNVHTRKIKIAANLLLSCRMISQLENKNLHQDYAALVFSRKTNKEKMFEFMVDMRWTERIIQALQIIIQENPVFFNKKNSPASTQKS